MYSSKSFCELLENETITLLSLVSQSDYSLWPSLTTVTRRNSETPLFMHRLLVHVIGISLQLKKTLVPWPLCALVALGVMVWSDDDGIVLARHSSPVLLNSIRLEWLLHIATDQFGFENIPGDVVSSSRSPQYNRRDWWRSTTSWRWKETTPATTPSSTQRQPGELAHLLYDWCSWVFHRLHSCNTSSSLVIYTH